MREDKIDLVKVEKLRRHRRRRKNIVIITLLMALCLVLAYFTGLYGASMSVLGDLVDGISVTLNAGEGYPTSFSMPGFIKARSLAGGFAALGESDFAIYSPSGKELRRLQHGYARPVISVGKRRVALYNRAGTELRIESRSRNLFKKIFDQPIMLAQMSEGGSFAVITRSLRYEAELTVYNSMFEEAYYWYSAKDTPVAAALSRDGRKVAVAAVYAQDGALCSGVYMLDIGKDEPVAQISSADTVPLMLQYLPTGDLVILYDSFACVYSGDNGEELARYSYGGRTLQTASIEPRYLALLFTLESQESASSLVLLDEKLNELASADIGRSVTDICTTNSNVHILLEQSVLSYGLDGGLWGETQLEAKALAMIAPKEQLVFTNTNVLPFETPDKPKVKGKSIFDSLGGK